jgi:hypothetical protein
VFSTFCKYCSGLDLKRLRLVPSFNLDAQRRRSLRKTVYSTACNLLITFS